MSRTLREKPSPLARAALARFASEHRADTSGALALLALGVSDSERKQSAEALKNLEAARLRLPQLADYVAWFIASTRFESGAYAEAANALDPVWAAAPLSPLLARSVVLAARAHIESGAPAKAVELLRNRFAQLSQPQGELVLASALDAAGDRVAAARSYQRIFYQYPRSAEAAPAEAALARLRVALATAYPPAGAETRLNRAFLLLDGGESRRARKEIEALLPQLDGEALEVARVRIGAADYNLKLTAAAHRYLKALTLSTPAADAERLFHLLACARRLERSDEMNEILVQLAARHQRSPWRLQALVTAANHWLLKNDVARYEPLYRACYEDFAGDRQASYCHWKVAWTEYLRRGSAAPGMLRAHLRDYPASPHASAALYFLGRLSEEAGDFGAAKACYTRIAAAFPNQYYAVLARERLSDGAIVTAVTAEPMLRSLAAVTPPPLFPRHSFEPTPATRLRVERANLLASAGLEDYAETELRFGARSDEQAHILAMELARAAARRGAPERGIRVIKSVFPGYLRLPLDGAPDSFWRLAFPLPYRADVERLSRQRSLDPYLTAALVRQESEFDPKALSPAKAMGLTQVRPSTGREISRKVGIKRFTARMLYTPELNLQLGTYYLRSLLDSLGGRWEPTLASYNAGKSRVDAWLRWGAFREPAEFIESIPITQTRDYVQIVLRNADLYRRLYDRKSTAVPSMHGPVTAEVGRQAGGDR